MSAGKTALAGLSQAALTELLSPLPSFRSRQIQAWVYRGASSFQAMSDLPQSLRDELAGRFSLCAGEVSARLEDPDGTVKLRVRCQDGAGIEAVLLTDPAGRKTACLSTQAGCAAGCVFCKTGALGFTRNLEAAEIVEQLLFLLQTEPAISNIVIMGMGEPLYNLQEVRAALEIITSPGGLAWSPRRITLSTCGIIEGIRDLADGGPPVRLALSLTTADAPLRERLMPPARAHPLPALKEALLYYQQKTGRRITLEAALLGGVNTRPQDAAAIAAFAQGLDAAVNLIPWNPVPGMVFEGRPLREPGRAEAQAFAAALEKRGLSVTFRFKKGRSVCGACGQLGFL